MVPVQLIGALLAILNGYANAEGGTGGTGDFKKKPQRADSLPCCARDSTDLPVERHLPFDSDQVQAPKKQQAATDPRPLTADRRRAIHWEAITRQWWMDISFEGGSLLKNLDKRIREETGLPVSIAEDPLASVVLGTAKMLTDFGLVRRVAIE